MCTPVYVFSRFTDSAPRQTSTRFVVIAIERTNAWPQIRHNSLPCANARTARPPARVTIANPFSMCARPHVVSSFSQPRSQSESVHCLQSSTHHFHRKRRGAGAHGGDDNRRRCAMRRTCVFSCTKAKTHAHAIFSIQTPVRTHKVTIRTLGCRRRRLVVVTVAVMVQRRRGVGISACCAGVGVCK